MREIEAQVVQPDALSAIDLAQVGMSLAAAGSTDRARRWVDAAVERDPANMLALTQRAMVALDAGRLDQAERDLDRACASPRLVASAHWLLAGLRRWTPQHNHLRRLDALAARSDLTREDRIWLCFARHKELDDLARHDAAWAALDEGCRHKRASVAHDADEDDALCDRLLTCFDEPLAGLPLDAGPLRTPIFIVGMHRSGTSLLERLLEGHPCIAAGGESTRWQAAMRHAVDVPAPRELDPALIARLPGVDADRVGRAYLASNAWLHGSRSHFTEKLPSNVFWLGLIRQALPHARVVLLTRAPMDACWSNLRELFSGDTAAHSYDQCDLARACARHARVVAHWKRRLPDFICEVPYEELVREPEAELRRVLQFCGLPWHADCLALTQRTGPVRTASAVQVREAVHLRSLERWGPYREHLRPLEAELRRLGLQ